MKEAKSSPMKKLEVKDESPKPSTMSFTKALDVVVGGDKIHKLEWDNHEYYGKMRDDVLVIHKPEGGYYDWIISRADMEGEDWVVIN